MANRKARERTIDAEPRAHVDELLDEAPRETFPASDPVSIKIDFMFIDSITSHGVTSQEAAD